jgi:tetratricopeptide (TPR) repeat protein
LAEKVLTKGLTANNNSDPSGVITNAFGDLYFEKKNYSLAADLYLESAMRKPYDIDRWVKASTILFPVEVRDLVFAENVLLEGIKNNPNSSVLMHNIGLVMHFTDRVDKAIRFYEEAIRLDSNDTSESKNINGLLNYAKILISSGSIQESLDILLYIVNHSPDNQECNSLLGAVLLGVNQTSLAEGYLYSASKLSVPYIIYC